MSFTYKKLNIAEKFKLDKWWVYKIGTGVFTLILANILLYDKVFIFKNSDYLLFTLLILLAINGHLINDYSDYDNDKKVGKRNIFDFISILYAPYLIILLAALTIFLTAYYFSNLLTIFIGVQILSSIIYSIKPFRVKEKGLLALILTGFYERLNPYLIILLYVAPNFYQLSLELNFLFISYIIWAYFWECRNFINGQLNDIENDKQSNVRSLIIRLGKRRIDLIKKGILIIELIILIIWLSTLVFIDFNYLYFMLCILFLQLIQVYGSRQLYSKIEVILDNCYSNIFMASLLIVLMILNKVDLITALILILLFQYRIIVDLADFIYYRIRYVITVGLYIIKKRLIKK